MKKISKPKKAVKKKPRVKNNIVSIDRKAITVHPDIVAHSPHLVDKIKKNAIKAGLSAINYEGYYELVKTGAKKESSYGYPNEMTVMKWSRVYAVGNETLATLYFNGPTSWYKLSPVKSCKKIRKHYKIETENSFYTLKRVDE